MSCTGQALCLLGVIILTIDTVHHFFHCQCVCTGQVLRLLRLVRLVRLVRILKTAELFRRWETQIAVSYSHLKLIRFSVAVLLSAHWLACGFYLVVVLEDQPVRLISSCPARHAIRS